MLLILLLACSVPFATSAPPAPPSPTAELSALDTRQPLPLEPAMALHQKAQMRGHLEAVQQVMAGLAAGDWAAIEAASARMGSSPGMLQTCERMGAGAAGFTEQAADFHRRADTIGAAARAHDSAAALAALSDTLSACTACHARWRQDVVSPEAYEAAASTAQPAWSAAP